jgi:hypothetical protein
MRYPTQANVMQTEAMESNRMRLAVTQRGHLQRAISNFDCIIVRLLTNQIGELIGHLNSKFTPAHIQQPFEYYNVLDRAPGTHELMSRSATNQAWVRSNQPNCVVSAPSS